MGTKELIEKFANGEITEEQFDTEASKLTPEEKEELANHAEKKIPDAVEKLKGVRRGIEKVAGKTNHVPAGDEITRKLREENFESALNSMYSELGIDKEEDKAAFAEGFKAVDSGNVTPENIAKDMRKYYASTQSDEYFELKKDKLRREQEAEEFNAQNGGTNGSGGGNETMKKASKEVQDFIKMAQKQGRTYTVEQAERAISVAKRGGRIG